MEQSTAAKGITERGDDGLLAGPLLEPAAVVVTESRPTEVLATLHESAAAEREYLFAARDADPADLILVAWHDGTAVGYIATTDQGHDGLLVWEHLVVPAHRNRGLGERLLLEAARRTAPGAVVEVDPLGELDTERVADYYHRLGFHREAPEGRIWATATDVIRALTRRGATSEHEVTVQHLLDRKAPGVVTVEPRTSIAEAIALLNAHHIGAVVVSSDGARIEGILSERDVLTGLDEVGPDFLSSPVADATTTDVLTCTTADSLVSAMESMTRLRIRHLPVTETGRLTGIISIGDLVSFRLDAVEGPSSGDTSTATEPTG